MQLAWTVMAEGLRLPEGPVALPDGSVVLSEIAAGRITHVLADGRTRVLAEPPGGPNGLAVAPDGALICCNGGGSRFRERRQPDGSARLEAWGASPEWQGGWIERIDARTGRSERLGADVGYRVTGHLLVAETEPELSRLAARAAHVAALGFTHERMADRAEVRALVPTIAPHILGGLWGEGDGHADPRATVTAFRDAAERAGATILECTAL